MVASAKLRFTAYRFSGTLWLLGFTLVCVSIHIPLWLSGGQSKANIICLMKKRRDSEMRRMFPLLSPVPALGKTARRMLLWELPLVLLAAVVLLVVCLSAYETDPLLAARTFAEAPFYILASLVLSVSTSLLCDLAERRR